MSDTAEPTKARPIIFSRDAIPAILDGRKTQTRRVIRHAPFRDEIGCAPWCWRRTKRASLRRKTEAELLRAMTPFCPYGAPGGGLWVRETFAVAWTEYEPCREDGQTDLDVPHRVEYRADTGDRHPGGWPDDAGDDADCPRWRPSIYMPRWASRISLTILDVRVQRIHDITEADILAEGCPRSVALADRLAWFRALWDSLNAKRGGGWSANPWVWALECRRVTKETTND
uniref:Morphogenetic protein n=1 Tax=viral metagenome TaxID=1070528 RepID=A0A6M3L897_9ZZZZ